SGGELLQPGGQKKRKGIYPGLFLLGIHDRLTPKLASEISLTAVIVGSYAEARQVMEYSLTSRGYATPADVTFNVRSCRPGLKDTIFPRHCPVAGLLFPWTEAVFGYGKRNEGRKQKDYQHLRRDSRKIRQLRRPMQMVHSGAFAELGDLITRTFVPA
ncbi:hypothetical protein VU00_12361, partial [Candidatus Electrothrix marina]